MAKIKPQKLVNNFFKWLEAKRLVESTPGFIHDFRARYPELKTLEENAAVIQRECLNLLKQKEKLQDIKGIAGKKTAGGIHVVQWKSFMFKAGVFVENNCKYCPETAALLKQIPGIKQAFFSILDPHQYIIPHRGYYYGFLRYHLGVIIPENNETQKCWLRINDDLNDLGKKARDPETIKKGEKYYWKNGEGIMFNDNYQHDAANDSDEVRVVLWLDVVRKYPFWLSWLNKLLLFVAYRSNTVRKIAKNSEVVLSNS